LTDDLIRKGLKLKAGTRPAEVDTDTEADNDLQSVFLKQINSSVGTHDLIMMLESVTTPLFVDALLYYLSLSSQLHTGIASQLGERFGTVMPIVSISIIRIINIRLIAETNVCGSSRCAR
jgi:hypothetical protein